MEKRPLKVVSSPVRLPASAVNSNNMRSRSASGRPSVAGPGPSLHTGKLMEPEILPFCTLNFNGCERVDAGERLPEIMPLYVGRLVPMLFIGALPAQGMAL